MANSYEYKDMGTARISYDKYSAVHKVRASNRDVRVELKAAESDGKLVVFLQLDEARRLYEKLQPLCVPCRSYRSRSTPIRIRHPSRPSFAAMPSRDISSDVHVFLDEVLSVSVGEVKHLLMHPRIQQHLGKVDSRAESMECKLPERNSIHFTSMIWKSTPSKCHKRCRQPLAVLC